MTDIPFADWNRSALAPSTARTASPPPAGYRRGGCEYPAAGSTARMSRHEADSGSSRPRSSCRKQEF
jgi:hypothetical protein